MNISAPASVDVDPEIVRAFIQEYFDAWKGTDVDRIMSYYARDLVLTVPTGTANGAAAVRSQFVEPFVTAFPGNIHTIIHLAHAPGLVAVEWTFEACHRGPFAGLMATGRSVKVPGCSIYEYNLETRLITAGRIYFDRNTFLQQLGTST